MRPVLIAVAVILIGGGLALWFMNRGAPPPQAAPEAPAGRVETVTAARDFPLAPLDAPLTAATARSADAGARTASRAVIAFAGAAPASASSKPMTATELADLKLTRTLTGEHRFTQEGRLHTVLGTKDTDGVHGGTQAMLVTRDEVSGQITYSLPSLQFTLNGGIDADTFIAEHPRMKKRFANTLYLQVDLDAADISTEFAAAARDPRVAKVGFVPLPTRKSTR